MGGLRRGLLGVAVVATVLAGACLPAVAATDRRAPAAVATKSKKKPNKAVAACKLLSVAEITQALGVAPTEPPKSDSASECDYSAPAYYNFININVVPLVSPALWVKEAGGGGATIPVTGIGDQAFRSASNGTIMVRKGKRTLRIDQYVVGLDETVIENLGKTAAAKL
jgi:hypothetical protein